ncbi:RHS repeat-associated core domain-containing protein, partial [Paracidovorax valerianellae]
DPTIGQYVTQDPIGLNGGINKSSYPVNPMNWVDPMGLDPMSGPKGPDIGHAKGWYDKIKDMLDFKENVQAGRDIKSDKDKLMCRAEKEMSERVGNEQLTPEAEKAARAAKEISTSAAGPVAEAFELLVNKDVITGAAKAYGYISAPAKDCATLLSPGATSPGVDFFKK